jgi:hypothetical protein
VERRWFGGRWSFVKRDPQVIPSKRFLRFPRLSVTPSGITCGYSLGLPTIAVGIFSLSNVSLGADSISVRQPARFLSVSISLSGSGVQSHRVASRGGGFFAIAIGSNGVQESRAALEFGAEISITWACGVGSV